MFSILSSFSNTKKRIVTYIHQNADWLPCRRSAITWSFITIVRQELSVWSWQTKCERIVEIWMALIWNTTWKWKKFNIQYLEEYISWSDFRKLWDNWTQNKSYFFLAGCSKRNAINVNNLNFNSSSTLFVNNLYYAAGKKSIVDTVSINRIHIISTFSRSKLAIKINRQTSITSS